MIPQLRKPNHGGYIRCVTRVTGQVIFEARYCGVYLGRREKRSDAEDLIREAQEADPKRVQEVG